MKKGDVIRQKCVSTTFYLTGILAHKVNNWEYFPSSTCSVGPSQIKLLAICEKKHEKTVIFFPKPKRIWLYCRGSVAYFVF